MKKQIRRLFSFCMATALCITGMLCTTASNAEEPFVSSVIQPDTNREEVYNVPLNITNPVIPTNFPDPELRCYKDADGNNVYWMYATAGHNIRGIYSTDNMTTWVEVGDVIDTQNHYKWINEGTGQVWAPGAIELDGKYYIVFSANNVPDSSNAGGIAIGVADDPAGPFVPVEGTNDGLVIDATIYDGITQEFIDTATRQEFKEALAGKPTLIDVNIFQDDDGTVYLYFGGGGNCGVAILNDDLNGLVPFEDGALWKPITGLSEYCEAPFMIKRGGTYYLTYSKGVWSTGTYASMYGMADNPFGPFTNCRQILKSSEGNYPYMGPGHNSVLYMPENNMWLICYHRYNYDTSEGRKPCIDRLVFNADGSIHSTELTDGWSTDDIGASTDDGNLSLNATAIDSSTQGGNYGYYGGNTVGGINDADYLTGWQYNTDRCNNGVLTDCWAGLDFGTATAFDKVVIDWESGTKATEDGFTIQYSDDGITWNDVSNAVLVYDNTSEITFDSVTAQYVRVNMTKSSNDKYPPKIFEFKVYNVGGGTVTPPPADMLGDVNKDGSINSTDFMQVRRHYLGLYTIPEENLALADVNKDGKINSTDFMQIRRHFLGIFEIEG